MANEAPALPKGFTAIQPAVPAPALPGGMNFVLDDARVDKETGVPKTIRAQLGAYYKPEDKLAFLKTQYSQVVPYGSDNFAVWDDQKAQWFLANPEGLDWGDVAEHGRIIPEMAGGFAGAVGGSFLGPAGTYGGGIVGSQVAGEGYDALVRAVAGTPDTRTTGEFAQDVGINTAIDTATLGAGEAAGPLFRKVFGKSSGSEVAQSAQNLGMNNLPAGAVGNRGVATAEGYLGQTLTAGGQIQKLYDSSIKELDDAIMALAGDGGRMSQADIGSTIINRAKAFKDKFTARSDELYGAVDKLIPPGRNFEANNTLELIDTLTGSRMDSQALAESLMPSDVVSKLKALYKPNAADIPEGATQEMIDAMPKLVSYRDLKALRTYVGNKLGDGLVLGTDADKATLKQIYGALTKDMDEVAQGLGGEAAKAASNASRYYQRGMTAIDNQIAPLVQKNSTTFRDPQQVFNTVNTMGRNQQGTINRQLEAFVPPAERQLIGGKQLAEAGRTQANPDLSPSRFVSDMNRMRAGTGQLPKTVQTLPSAKDAEVVAGGLKDAQSRMNFSNTAGAMMGNEATRSLATIAAAGMDPTILIGQILIPKGLAHLMENRAFRAILSDTVSPVTKQKAQLIALGLNESVANEILDHKYRTPAGLMND